MTRIKLGEVNYNRGIGAFEAAVDIFVDGRCLRYPCSVQAASDMDRQSVRVSLARQAIGLSSDDIRSMS